MTHSTTSPLPAAGAAVILVAAGSGQRLGRGIPKARVLCAGRTLLEHALDGILAAQVAASVIVVLPQDDAVLTAVVERLGARGAAEGIRVDSVTGGSTRTASVQAGLAALPGSVGVVLVHDAARALTPPDVFLRVAAAVAAGAEAVVPVLPVVDTVKIVTGTVVTATPDRSTLRAVQTPQGFAAAGLRAAHLGVSGTSDTVTDDAMLMEAVGARVHVVDGDALAFKVTTPLDLLVAEAVLAQRAAPPSRESLDPSPPTGA